MARPSTVWLDKSKGTYRSTIGGVRVTLCKASEGKRRAVAILAELVTAHGAKRAGAAGPMSVGRLLTMYLHDLANRREATGIEHQTKDDVSRRLAGFADMHGDLPADDIRPHHVDQWLATKTTWKKTSRHDGVGAVKSAFKWAIHTGHIDRNPLAEVKKPKRAKREKAPSPENVGKVLHASMTAELRDLLTFIYSTGCRPKEARVLEAAHLDRVNGLAALPKHKTSAHTDKPRVLYLAGPSAEIAYRLADLHPEGPIFRNSKDKPWTSNALVHSMARLRKRTGLGKEVVAYGLRHAYATDGLLNQVSAALVAELMGHEDLRMMSTYSHVSEHHDALKEAAEKFRGALPPSDVKPL